MTPDVGDLPKVARGARALGVRIPEDVVPDAEGFVAPETGGLSVAPDSVFNLPNHRRPCGMGRGSTGPANDWVFGIEEPPVNAVGLGIRPDPVRPNKHAFVEPRDRIPLGEYESAIVGTRPAWGRVWP
jgi:hypothetical protein